METETKVFILGMVAVITIILSLILGNCYRDIRMAELGYEEVALAGKLGTAWQKAKVLCKERE